MENFFVYIITNKNRRVLYIGVTNNLEIRLWQHRQKVAEGFSSRYHLSYLLYYEPFPDPRSAIEREKQLKRWKRHKKVKLIETMNPRWLDLSESLFGNNK